MNVIDYFGPRVAKVTLEPDFVELLHNICLDSDISYYHHFEIGEVICISNYYNPTLEYIINKTHKWNTKYKFEYFSRNWSSTNHQRWTIPECVYHEYFKEVDVPSSVIITKSFSNSNSGFENNEIAERNSFKS